MYGFRVSVFKNHKRHSPYRWYGSRRNIAGTNSVSVFILSNWKFFMGLSFRIRLIGWIMQLQRLIHLMLENLSSLLESISAVKQKGKAEEESAHPLEDFIPSLCKIRKLSGRFPHCWQISLLKLVICRCLVFKQSLLITSFKICQNC